MASQDEYKNMSRRLSRVMGDIGVNKEDVMSRRRAHLIEENILTLYLHLIQDNKTIYVFGSQTEGSTTAGLKSDTDFLVVHEHYNLIQDQNDWVPGKNNLLMIEDEKFTGYCKLQALKSDGPYPEGKLPNDQYSFDVDGRVILHNTFKTKGKEREGPSVILLYYEDSSLSFGMVPAIRCKTWPNGYKTWSQHPKKGTWPTSEMISFIENSGCFVVPVAHHLDEKKSESWRISTSLAERCLMLSLNITQIRCYKLIKMIVKTFIDPVVPDVISSYICKNLLFHCVENTRPDFWQESNLLRCVNQVLQNMLVAVLCMNCPNYFNESINLILGKVNNDNQIKLMSVIWKVLVSDGGFLAEIRFDNIRQLIHSYDDTNYNRNDCSHGEKHINPFTLGHEQVWNTTLSCLIKELILSEIFNQQNLVSIQNMMLMIALQGPLQYISATLLFPFLCSHLATQKASEHILRGEMLSDRTSLLYERSLDSDVTSSRLKYASYLYCTGKFKKAKSVLEEARALDGSFAICGCEGKRVSIKSINRDRSQPIQCLSPSIVSMCVMFSQAERRCCPRELQYEMYRSSEQEKLQRDKSHIDNWMDLACIDPDSYSSFLYYMTSRHLGLRELQLSALKLLTEYASRIVRHRDTVYNLLGQCYEYENIFEKAFACYCKSLRIKPTNNAARWRIVLLLYTVYQI